ncbi:MAG: IS110 family transposase [Archaeoglobaceae archaeon]
MIAGIDVGARYNYVAIAGKVTSFKSEQLHQLVDHLISSDVTHAVLEPTGRYHIPLCKLLILHGITPLLVHTTRFGRYRMAFGKSKDDESDALLLAQLGESNSKYLFEVDESTLIAWDMNDLVREHIRLKTDRTREINRLRQDIYSIDPSSAFDSLTNLVEHPLFSHRCQRIKELTSLLKDVDEKIKDMIEDHEDGKILTSIPGVGHVTAALLISRYVNVNRYESVKHFQAMLGFSVLSRKSGTSINVQKTAKAHIPIRSAMYRTVMVNINKQNRIAQMYAYYRKRMPAKKAIMRTSAKLIGWIYYMLKQRKAWHVFNEYKE